MKLFREIPKKSFFKSPVITIGNFDGVHIGHKKILAELSSISKKKFCDDIVLTFSNHPKSIINPDKELKIITTIDEKIEALRYAGINNIIILEFSKEMSGIDALEFYDKYLINKIGAKEIVVGHDHAFGKNRKGNINFLEELSLTTGVKVTSVDGEKLDGKTISSTWLRDEIKNGNMERTQKLLGRRYKLSGSITRGEGRGKTFGFPTANIIPESQNKLIPGDGVYAVSLLLYNGIKKFGMINIGKNPTFSMKKRSLEVNIFDFNKDIYDTKISIEFHKKIRDEVKFNTENDLINQIKQDKEKTKNILNI